MDTHREEAEKMSQLNKSSGKKNTLLGKFVGNTWWMMFQRIYQMLIQLVVGSLSARYLGPSNYGLINYGSSIIAFFLTVSKLGMDSVVVAEMARSPKKESSYLGTALLMRFIASLLSFFAIWGIVILLEPGNTLLQVVTVLQAIAIIFQSTEVLYFWFQARLEMKYVTLTTIIALTVTAVWRVSLLANSAAVQWFALSSSISALVCGVCIVVFFAYKAKFPLSISLSDGKFIISNSYHFIINGLAVTLYTQLDRIMLGKVVSQEAVGFYSAASTIAVMWEFIPTAIVNSARPLLVKLYDKNEEDFTHKFQLLLLGISVMGIVVGVVFSIFAKPFILILYGKEYYPSIPALGILIWSTSFAMIGTARGVWIVAERKNKYQKYFTLVGAAVNAVLNALVIPFWGITGASVTTLLSQICVAVVTPYLFKETKAFSRLYFDSFKLLPEAVTITKRYFKQVIR